MTALIGQLRAWRRREWLYSAMWGAARWLVLVVAVVAMACFTDWFIDRFVDTPFLLRFAMTAGQLGLFAGAFYWLVVRLRVPSLVALASRAERAVPEFDHRLVTAIQLNRPTARTAGMSARLIGEVTREAETLSARHRLASLADPARVKWAAGLALPVLLVAGGFAAARPELVRALLARQALLSADIPRSVRLANITPELWPSGDEVELRIVVSGDVSDDTTGTAVVFPEGQPSETFALTPTSRQPDGAVVLAAKLPPSSVPFTFHARAADGRLKPPGAVRFAPRPVVNEISAWVVLPAYVDPTGKTRYERFQPQAEVLAVADSSIRVAVTVSKPVTTARVVVLARGDDGKETEATTVPLTIAADGQTAEGVVPTLPPRPTGYRVEVVDENGFANANQPRRGITLAPDEPPRVGLLPEVLKDPAEPGPLDDFAVDGMPLRLGGQVQVGYAARSPLGVDRARIVYRVNDGPWSPLPLTRVDADPGAVGRFLPELGLFEKSGYDASVEFYPLPSPDPAAEPPGLEAGGRYNFQTAALTKQVEGGRSAKLEIGDRVEFYVEGFDRNPAPGRPAGRSESRIKTVVSEAQFAAWMDQHNQSRDRLRQLEERQRGVFARPKTDR